MFSFEYPAAFSLIILVIICLFFCKIKKRSIYFPQTKLLSSLLYQQQILLNLLKFLILTLLIIALASPIKTDDFLLDNTQGYEISLILDASGSMEKGNKFSIVKNIVADFIDQRKTDKLALSIFADFAYVAVPLTYDKSSIKRLLNKIEVGIAGRKTALYEALFLSSKLYKTSQSKEKIAILLTDGTDNASTIPIDVAIRSAKKYKIKVYTIGIGRPQDFRADILQQIAVQTGGKHFAANNVAALQKVYDTINSLEKSELQIDKYAKKTYYFHYFLMAALLLAFLYFYRVRR